MKLDRMGLVLIIAGVMVLFGNTVSYKMPVGDAAIGYLVLVALTLSGVLAARGFPIKLPFVFWVSIIAVFSTSAISPLAEVIVHYSNQVNFLALTTPILAYAGLAVGKDLGAFKQVSWRIVLVALTVFTGTFFFATLTAQAMLTLEGSIK